MRSLIPVFHTRRVFAFTSNSRGLIFAGRIKLKNKILNAGPEQGYWVSQVNNVINQKFSDAFLHSSVCRVHGAVQRTGIFWSYEICTFLAASLFSGSGEYSFDFVDLIPV